MFFTRSKLSHSSAGILSTPATGSIRESLQTIYGVTSSQVEKEDVSKDLIHMKIQEPIEAEQVCD